MKKQENNERVESIYFMLGSCEYRLKQLKKEVKAHDQQIKTERKDIPIPLIPITLIPNKGYGAPLYEFHAFLTDLITCVNYTTDLKVRVKDGYKKEFSLNISTYCGKKFSKKIKDTGKSHELICTNFSWIEKLNEIRNHVIHTGSQNVMLAYLDFKEERVIIKVPYLQPDKSPEIYEFCSEQLKKLEKFVEDLLHELEIKKP